jgi:SP family general alpha glucoside:H+ symporter-like MFS transporter
MALLIWALTADKFGRRTIINSFQTLVCIILFVVGGLFYTGATDPAMATAATGTALVRTISRHALNMRLFTIP